MSGQFAVFQDFVNNRVPPAHALQTPAAVESLPALVLRERSGASRPRAFKEHIRKLLGGIDIEGLADPRVDGIRNALDLRVQLLREIPELRAHIQEDALLLHIRQHRDKF